MNEELAEQIRINMELRSTEELRRILQENMQGLPAEELTAIRRVLEARGESLGSQASAPNKPANTGQSQRPGCITAAAILLGIVSLMAVMRAVLSVLATGDEGALVGLVTAAILGVVYFLVARGLWRLKNWARIAFIVLNGLSMLLAIAMAVSLPDLAPGVVVGLVIGGYVIYWFASHGEYFR